MINSSITTTFLIRCASESHVTKYWVSNVNRHVEIPIYLDEINNLSNINKQI
jgi:hypothetical protein